MILGMAPDTREAFTVRQLAVLMCCTVVDTSFVTKQPPDIAPHVTEANVVRDAGLCWHSTRSAALKAYSAAQVMEPLVAAEKQVADLLL